MDLCGPFLVPSLGKSRYFLLLTDDYSWKSWIYFLTSKSNTLAKFKIFHSMLKRQTSQKLLQLQSDRGGKFLSQEFNNYLITHGIIRELTIARTSQQNGVIKRKNWTMLNKLRFMLNGGSIPTFLWVEAVQTMVKLINYTPTRTNPHTTPEEMFTGLKFDLSRIRVFGCIAHIHQGGNDKLASRSTVGAYLGTDVESKAYRVWVPSMHQVIITRNVVFNEDQFLNTPKLDTTFFDTATSTLSFPTSSTYDDNDFSQMTSISIASPQQCSPNSSSHFTDPTPNRP